MRLHTPSCHRPGANTQPVSRETMRIKLMRRPGEARRRQSAWRRTWLTYEWQWASWLSRLISTFVRRKKSSGVCWNLLPTTPQQRVIWAQHSRPRVGWPKQRKLAGKLCRWILLAPLLGTTLDELLLDWPLQGSRGTLPQRARDSATSFTLSQLPRSAGYYSESPRAGDDQRPTGDGGFLARLCNRVGAANAGRPNCSRRCAKRFHCQRFGRCRVPDRGALCGSQGSGQNV